MFFTQHMFLMQPALDDDTRRWVPHLTLILSSYRHWTGRDFIEAHPADEALAQWIFKAPFALLSHGREPDPLFNYANQSALEVFGMKMEEMMAWPSRFSAEACHRDERARLLSEVAEKGYSEGYQGIRQGRRGRFEIIGAKVWNLVDAEGIYQGQAASFSDWHWLKD